MFKQTIVLIYNHKSYEHRHSHTDSDIRASRFMKYVLVCARVYECVGMCVHVHVRVRVCVRAPLCMHVGINEHISCTCMDSNTHSHRNTNTCRTFLIHRHIFEFFGYVHIIFIQILMYTPGHKSFQYLSV